MITTRVSDDPTTLPPDPPAAPAAQTAPEPADPWGAPVALTPPEPPSGSRRRRWPVVVLVVVLVAAIAAGGYALSSRGGDETAAPAEPGDGGDTEVPTPVQASGLKARATSFKVSLDWSKGAGDPHPANYLVYRDGSLQDTVAADETKYVDETVIPGTKYRYKVVAADAEEQDFPVGAPSVKAKTPPAPPSTARLEGIFNVRFTETSKFGFAGSAPLIRTLGFKFKPTCTEGPCDTDLVVLRFQGFRTELELSGDSYRGSASVHGFSRCGSVSTSSSVSLIVRPSEAGEDGGEWRVTEIAGTISIRVASQLGCTAGGSDLSLVGKPV